MNRGYVRLWRKLLDAGWLKNHRLCIFWIYCLLKASHKIYTAIVGSQTVDLLPGQFIFGLRKAAEETGLTVRQIRTCLAFLISTQNLTIKPTNKFSIITIVNWHIYQMAENENDTQNDKPPTSKRQHTRIKEHKKTLYNQSAFEVLSYLNEKTGKRFSNADHIQARLNNGGTVEDCKRIIDTKIKDQWFINDNYKFMRPSTLFCKAHFDEYLNEALSTKAKPSW